MNYSKKNNKGKDKTYSHFREYIYCKVTHPNFLKQFIFGIFPSYKTILNYADKLNNISGDIVLIEKFYNLFGYSMPNHTDKGMISSEFREFFKDVKKTILVETVAKKHFDYVEAIKKKFPKENDERKSIKKQKKKEPDKSDREKGVFITWDPWTVHAIITLKARNGPKYIYRNWLHFFAFSCELKMEQVKQLFAISDCIFKGSYLPEDRILYWLLDNKANDKIRDLSFELFLEKYKEIIDNL